ncbi:DUF5134 domain-containing protein [Paramicrobacterium chengjingii]|uniref:DUF5134 domain-containing protein n=1 Tax=Paramicrobacterium chengjingii TaxID=2769067 RepID=A0ABX6YGR6_9MICO|nr:DUF5134 domain-containing protein [Microbacterium chengjingii]QPZ37972.1 DUF5134 domain-containing protein [Microbacterium chengjingii]
MVEGAWLQWSLSLIFALTGLHSLGLTAASRSIEQATGHVLHVIMSLDMVAMCWPWWSSIPALPQALVFGAASAWFAGRIAWKWRRGEASPHFALHQLSHLVMMLVMVWMVVAMGPTAAAEGDAAPVAATGHSHGMLGPIAGLSGSVLVALLIAAGVLFCLTALRRDGGGRLHASANGAMCVGMVVMCWPMMAS